MLSFFVSNLVLLTIDRSKVPFHYNTTGNADVAPRAEPWPYRYKKKKKTGQAAAGQPVATSHCLFARFTSPQAPSRAVSAWHCHWRDQPSTAILLRPNSILQPQNTNKNALVFLSRNIILGSVPELLTIFYCCIFTMMTACNGAVPNPECCGLLDMASTSSRATGHDVYEFNTSCHKPHTKKNRRPHCLARTVFAPACITPHSHAI